MPTPGRAITLNSPTISLAQALKKAGIATTGGQGKHMVREGLIEVNGAVVILPGATLSPGDRFGPKGEEPWVVQA
ncbi:MAG: hypothetical protein EXR99_06830 [Gemmataceae bacterium]|nr:hypothetical protein [Gemmataceae bacterium]